jgi:RNA polymerase sigma-70 factor (ECF subfamily)
MRESREITQLIQRAINHDESACQKILNLYKGRVFSYAYRMVKNYHDAEDITFDAFIKCFNALPRFDIRKSFLTWLFTITHNVTMDYFRKNKQQYEYFDERHASNEDLAQDYAEQRKMERIDQALLRLPAIDRELIILFHKEDYSYQEISEIVDMPVTTIKTRLHRARKKLRLLVHEKPKKP